MSLKKYRNVISLLYLFFTLSMALCAGKSHGQKGKITALPQSLTVHVGQIFELTFFVDPGEMPVSVVDFVLSYETQFLEAISVDRIDSPLDINQISSQIVPEEGKIIYGAFKLSGPWPEDPFALVRIKFKATQEVPGTTLRHDLDKVPFSSMAFEGNSTLGSTPDINIHILPKIIGSSTDTKPDAATRLELLWPDDSPIVDLSFAVRQTGKTRLMLNNVERDTFTVYDYTAQAGQAYSMQIDTQILPQGQYKVELTSPEGASYSKEFMVTPR
jgi:hypothetical protein